MPAAFSESTDALQSPRVLVVEDDPETRHFYAGILAADGFDTYEAHNGFQAFAKAIETRPDLVLTDIAVPGLDGIELCRRLRADPRTSSVRVLAVTGTHRISRRLRQGSFREAADPPSVSKRAVPRPQPATADAR